MAITIHINADGTGRYVSDSSTRDIALGSVSDTRQALIDMAAKEAARQGREIPVTAHDNGQRFDILVSERGTARTNPAPQPAGDFIADVPGVQHSAPAVPEPAPMIGVPPMPGAGPAAPADDAASAAPAPAAPASSAPASSALAGAPSIPAAPSPGGRSAATADSAPTGPSAMTAPSAPSASPAPALPQPPFHERPRSPHLVGPRPVAQQGPAAALSPAAAPQHAGGGWSAPGATDWSAPAVQGAHGAAAAPVAQAAPGAGAAASGPSASSASVASAPSAAPAPVESPVVTGPPPSGPAVDENDPAWRQIAEKPAEQGLRGTLNGMGMKLAPKEAELAERRAAFAAQKAQEQQRHAEEEQARLAEEEQRRLAEEERARAEAVAQRAHESRQAARQREAAERDREQRRLIQTNFMGVKTILVANPKGGARKTTSTYLLAATMGIIRGGSVIAWDANETMGTLGERSQQDQHSHTVVDLLEQAAPSFTSIEGSRLGALDAYVRPQGDSHFDVLASDEDATRQDIVDREGFETVHEILSRFYRLILVDTGNNIRVPHFLAAVDQADQLVIPVAAGRDSARAAMKMMRSLEASGHGDLVESAVVLLHDLEPSTEAGSEYLDTVGSIAAEFEGQVAAVVAIPFDASLKGGDEIDHAELAPATRQAYQEAAAAVAQSLREGLDRDEQKAEEKATRAGAEKGERA
ncbi:hypothetical protein [Brachybacterium nesterenkovii]|uniref:hypothetical protein n=1 Tax=Brachybacterium nesterenkovii TaxID=47847 RepID=UPI00321C28AA